MLKKALGILALSAIATMTWANVDLRTNIQDIYYRGTCEEAGSITMSVNGNDFSTATTDEPVFIRVRLTRNAKLCQTLVHSYDPDDDNFNDPGDYNFEPIYLAMRLFTSNPLNTLLANQSTVSIVRWVETEREIWLRVQTSSQTWIQEDASGAAVPPSNQVGTVDWTFGVTGLASMRANASQVVGDKINLAFNQRGEEVEVAAGAIDPISTLICVDVSQSSLTPYPDNDSILQFDTISFDGTNQGWGDRHGDYAGDETSLQWAYAGDPIDRGQQFTTNFSGDDSIARGWDICFEGWLVGDKYAAPYQKLCIIAGGQGENDFGLVCFTNDILVHVEECADTAGEQYLPDYVGWFDDAGVSLTNETTDNWGFRANTLGKKPSSLYGHPGSSATNGIWFADGNTSLLDFGPFSSYGGYYLSKYVYVGWQGDGDYLPGGGFDIQLYATVCEYYTEGPNDVVISVQGFLTEDPEELDDFDDHCPIDPILVFEDTWNFGSFVECEGEPVSIFFPYVPRLVGTNYWAGVALVNQGARDFDPADGGGLMGSIYEADGTHYTVNFPALPVKTMQTWLLTSEGDYAFFQGAPGDPLTDGLTLDAVLDPADDDLAFGDARMSMYVTGFYPATYTTQLGGGDLDGYMLIGDKESGSVDGAYLPRNMDYTWTNQHADMPLVIRKK